MVLKTVLRLEAVFFVKKEFSFDQQAVTQA